MNVADPQPIEDSVAEKKLVYFSFDPDGYTS